MSSPNMQRFFAASILIAIGLGGWTTRLIALAVATTHLAQSASLRTDKAPDDSLCDLGPNTTEILGRKILAPTLAEDAPTDLWSEAYAQLAVRFVASSCSNGQLLILHTEKVMPLDVAYLPFLASLLCLEKDSAFTEVLSRSGTTGEQQRGFEVRCKISKFDKFKAEIEQLEKRESTESLIRRLQAQARKAPSNELKP
jgi:hypothetical protein